jgi:hypothetical protein
VQAEEKRQMKQIIVWDLVLEHLPRDSQLIDAGPLDLRNIYESKEPPWVYMHHKKYMRTGDLDATGSTDAATSRVMPTLEAALDARKLSSEWGARETGIQMDQERKRLESCGVPVAFFPEVNEIHPVLRASNGAHLVCADPPCFDCTIMHASFLSGKLTHPTTH